MAVERLEARTVLSGLSLTTVADGTVADRNLDGTFDTADTASTSITDRWSTDPTVGQERGVFEFDLSRIAPGTPILSASIGLQVTSYTSSTLNGVTTDPQLDFQAAPGTGTITTADGAAPSSPAGTDTVSSLGYQLFTLDPTVLQSLEGGFASVRMQNTALDADWAQVASLEDTAHRPATLIVQIPPTPAFSLSISPGTVAETAGAGAATAVLTRTGDLSTPLTVNLSSDDTSQLAVPATATFPAGQASVHFGVDAVDDQVYSGNHLVTVSAAGAAITDPFSLDPTFGVDGLAQTSLLTHAQFPRGAVAVQPDGKILAVGQSSGDTWALTRLNPDGSLDTTFGDGGVALVTLPTTGTSFGYPEPRKVVVQPDGSILVGGVAPLGGGIPAVCRFTASGQLDPSFGSGGIVELGGLEPSRAAWVEDIGLRTDGSILLAIDNGNTGYLQAAQLLADGSLDPSFGVGGITPQLVGGETTALALLPDGRFVLAGSATVARFDADGTALDTTFGSGGSVTIASVMPGASIDAAAIDSAGRIVVGAYATDPATHDGDMAAARLTADGSLDTTFGSGGTALVHVAGDNDTPTSLAVQPDGRIILGGLADTASNVWQSALVRLTADGAPDPTFNGDGTYQQTLTSGQYESICGLALQPAGDTLLALTGWNNDYRVARFTLANQTAVVSASAQVTVLEEDNGIPVAAAQSFETDEGTAYSGRVTASDPDGDALTYAAVTRPAHGALSLAADGSFTYTPASGYYGVDSFSFRASDGLADSNVAAVSITVNPALVANDDAYSVGKNGTLKVAAPGVLANDTGPAGATLSAVLLTRPATGTLSLGANGSFTYKPRSGFTGTDHFTYEVVSGSLVSNAATVTLTVAAQSKGVSGGHGKALASASYPAGPSTVGSPPTVDRVLGSLLTEPDSSTVPVPDTPGAKARRMLS